MFMFVIDQNLVDQLRQTACLIKENSQKIATEVRESAQNNPNNSFALQIKQNLQENTIGETLVKELKLEALKGEKVAILFHASTQDNLNDTLALLIQSFTEGITQNNFTDLNTRINSVAIGLNEWKVELKKYASNYTKDLFAKVIRTLELSEKDKKIGSELLDC